MAMMKALLRQFLHQVDEAFVQFTQQVRRRHAHLVEKQFGGIGGVLPDLLQLAPLLEAGPVGLDQEQRHPFGAGGGVGFGHDHDQIAIEAVADEGLAAVDHVLVAVPDRGGAYRFEVGAGAGLAHGDGEDAFSARALGQPAVLLLLRAEPVDIGGNDVRMQIEAGAADVRRRHFFDQHGAMAEVAATAAVFLRQRGAQ